MAGDKTTSGGLNFTYPSKGRANFSGLFDVLWAKISAHDHSGNGNGTTLTNSAFTDLSIRVAKLNIQNDEYLDALDNAGTGRVDMIKVNSSDVVELGTAPLAPHFTLTDGVTAPATTAGQAHLYIDTADGDLKIKFGDGTVKTITVDT